MTSLLGDAYDSLVPVNARQYLAALLGDRSPLTERHLWPSDINAIRYAIRKDRARRRFPWDPGMIGYGDYGPGDTIGSMTDRSIGGVVASSYNDPRFRMETLLGNARYYQDPRGHYIVTDEYNFNGDPKLVDEARRSPWSVADSLVHGWKKFGAMGPLNALGNLFIADKEERGAPVKIDVGSIDPGYSQRYWAAPR